MGLDTVLKVKRKNTIFWWLHNQGNRLNRCLRRCDQASGVDPWSKRRFVAVVSVFMY